MFAFSLILMVAPVAAQYVTIPSEPGSILDKRYDFASPRVVQHAIRVPRLQGRLTRAQLGIVINTADPYSVAVGEFYVKARALSPEQILRVQLPVRPSLTPSEFDSLAHEIDARFGAPIEALALAWVEPYAVNCNSITGALALGYDASMCANTCAPSTPSRYFNSATAHPRRDVKMRPSMLLAARDVAGAEAMISRGVASDGSLGLRGGTPVNAYFVTTSDAIRSVRSSLFPPSGVIGGGAGVEVKRTTADSIGDARQVLIYETGLTHVPELARVQWVNGALADHLTSFGGTLDGTGGQMTVLAWIDAGATASYGTVSEPCALTQKFPHPQVLLLNYLQGATAIEAYWKSVAWPRQGVFVGEPLAAPFARR